MSFFSFDSWLKNQRSSLHGTRRNKPRSAVRTIRSKQLKLEQLEDRVTPSLTAVAPAQLLDEWNFSTGTANDLVGTANGTLYGGATISNGMLQLNGTTAYMETPIGTSLSSTLTAKTLVSWVSLATLNQSSGSALTVETGEPNTFDAIDYAERVPGQWMAGSDNFNRSAGDNGGAAETVTSPGLVMMAIVYGADNSITLYRDGVLYAGPYTQGTLVTYPVATTDFLIGVRHADRIGQSGNYLDGSVAEAQVWGTALSAAQIASLYSQGTLPPGLTPPSATEGQAFTNQTVFRFSDADPNGTASDYTAVVALGDGNSVTLNSSGVVSGPAGASGQIVADANGGFDVQLSYTYSEALTNATFSVTVTDVGGSTASASTSTFNVAYPPPTAGTVSASGGVEGVTPTTLSATFTDANPYATTADFSGTINWGDGNTTTFTSSAVTGSNGSYTVSASYQYAEEGNYTISVTINDVGGASIGGGAGPLTLYATQESPGSAAFVSIDPTTGLATTIGTLSEATAEGLAYDPSSSTMYVAERPAGKTKGQGSTLYSVNLSDGTDTDIGDVVEGAGKLTVGVNVQDLAFDSNNDTLYAVDRSNGLWSIDPSTGAPTLVATLDNFVTSLAIDSATNTFYGEDGSGDLYTIDPGSGTTTLVGTANDDENGLAFNPANGQLYSSVGTSLVTIDPTTGLDSVVGGAELKASYGGLAFVVPESTTVVVNDAPLTTGTVSATGGVASVTPTTLSATFTDANVNAPASDFSGTINWGDGNAATPFTSADVTANGNGTFTINASYQYAEASGATPYTITVTIDDMDGSSTTDTGSTTVAAPLTAGALTPPLAIEGQPFSSVTVFHFTDGDPTATASDFTATVNTGDATLTSTANPSNVQIVANGDGFDVQLSYTYAEPIGDGTFSVTVTDAGGFAVNAATTSNFAVTLVRANGNVGQIGDVPTAETLLNTPSQQAAVFTDSPSVINYLGAGGGGDFGGDLVFPGESSTSQEVDLFAVEATANVVIPAAGNWTFGTNSDDGVRLTVGSQALEQDGTFPPTDTIATFYFPSAGIYPLDLIYYQSFGGAEVEVFAAQGSFTSFNSNFQLVGDTADGGLSTGFSVAYPPPTAGTVSASGGVAGVTPTTLSAAFTDTDVNAPTSEFSGTINWGDGNAATPFASADVTANGNGSFTVNASYQYAVASGATPYNITVTINDNGGSTTDTGTTTVLAAPTLSSTPSATLVALHGTGALTLTDTASLSGGYNETGTITFTLYDPNGNLVDTEYVTTVYGDGSYTTPAGYTLPTNVTVIGTYQWDASYGGDPNNNPASDLNDPAEQVTVSAANPILTTTPVSAAVTLGATTTTLKDTATLTNGYFPTGTVTFYLFAPGVTPAGDYSNAVYSETDPVSGGMASTATGYTLPTNVTVTGTYHWFAAYSGDGNNNNTVQAEDPTAYYRLNETSGTMADDSSGNGRNGTYQGGYTLGVPGPLPGLTAVSLDGTSGNVSVPASTVNNLSSGTIAAWVYLNDNTGETIFAKQNNGVNSYAIFTIGYTDPGGGGGTPGTLYFQADNQSGFAASTGTVSTGAWHYVAVVFSSTAATFYIDGVASGTTSGNYSIPNDLGPTSTTIGAWLGDGGGQYLNGSIAQFAAFGTALTASQIAAQYSAGGSGGFSVSPGPQLVNLGSFDNYNNGVLSFGSGLLEDSNGNLFGTASNGGASGVGTVFEVMAGSGVITPLASFNNSDGAYPYSNVVEDSHGDLFGTTLYGGDIGVGAVFEVVAGSGQITLLGSFAELNTASYPVGGLVMDANGNLFGAAGGGDNGDGTVYEVPYDANTNTYGAITPLASFDGTSGAGSYLAGVVVDSSGNLYGVSNNGDNGYGEVFEVAAGSGVITPLASFGNSNAGGNPAGGLIEDSSGNLFGTTTSGGADGFGTVFELVPSTAESVTVSPASPTVAVSSGQTTALLGTTSTLTASAVLAGGYYESGTITFTLHDPSGNLVDTESAAVTGNGTYTTSAGYALPDTAPTGVYQWDVSYSSDGNNNPASDLMDPNAQVAVFMATPTNTTIVSVIGDLGGQVASLPGGSTSPLGSELETDLIDAAVAAAQENVAAVNSALASFDNTALTALTTPGSAVNSTTDPLTTAESLLTAATNLYYTVNGIPLAPADVQQAELTDFDRMATNIPGGLTGGDPLVSAFTNIAQQGAVGNFAGLNSALATFDSTVRSELATPGSGVNLTNATAMLEASTALYYTVNGIAETPTVSVSDAGGTYDGMAFPATATVAGVVAGIDDSPAASLEDVTPSLTYYVLDAAGNKLSQLSAAPVDAGYYEVDANFAGSTDYTSAPAATTTFTITPKALTASVVGDPTKVYNGTTAATLTSSNFSLSGLVGSESFTVTQTAGTYNSKDTNATSVTASLSSSQFTAASGTLASDYTLPTTASGAGTIAAKTLTAAIVGDPTKTYNGTTAATLTSSNFSLTGLVGSESFTVTQTAGTYNSKDTSAATVTASLSSSQFTAASGTLASDYTLPTTASGAGTITPAAFTYQIGSTSQTYGTPVNLATALGTTISTGVNGENLAIAYSSSGDTASAAVGTYAITGVLSTGTGLLSDYNPTKQNGTLTVTLQSSPAGYILNSTAGNAVIASGNAVVKLPGGLYVDSSAANAVTASGNATINAGYTLQVEGGVTTSGKASATKTGTPSSTSDPLSSLPLPGVAGLTNYGAVSVSGNSSQTLYPGIYTSIQVSGNAKVTLSNSGSAIYIIEGGGLTVSGNASVSGTGVLIFNAGSAYNATTDGGKFGSINLGGNGTISLSGMTSGVYAGVAIFQSRSNTQALSLSGNGAAGITSTLYAPAANVGISGNAQVNGTLIAATLTVSGNAGAYQLADGSSSDYVASTANWITNTVLTVTAEDDTGDGIDANELDDVTAAMTYLNSALGCYGVNLSWAPDGTSADVTIHFASTTPEGDASDGVLGFTTATGDVYIVTAGWNYYTGSDPSAIGAGQYDFVTLATHELAHAVGLGESVDPSSVMYEYLAPGTVRRTFTDGNLTAIDTNADRFMKAALPALQRLPGSLNLDSTWSTPMAAALSSPLAVAAPCLSLGTLPAVLLAPAGSFGWESAVSGSSVSPQDGHVAATPGLDGDDSVLVGGSGNALVIGGQGRNGMTGDLGLEHGAEDGAEHGALDQLFASGELDLVLQPAAPSLASR